MSLTLHMQPLASCCWKVLIAFYENDTPFEAKIVDLSGPAETAAFQALWPTSKMPLLRDDARDQTVRETPVIIEYLQTWSPGPVRFIPGGAEAALDVRLMDRLFDLYVQEPMQKIVGDQIRPAVAKDSYCVAQAPAQLAMAYDLIEARLADRPWAAGEVFGLADCAAATALFYADRVAPLAPAHPNTSGYLDRLLVRPSASRVIEKAQPYFAMFPT
ncbi:glutathione S-transferase family protein [Caulobacter sp. DWR2-3-1b2]|uniref:glutathione S-transferase family protein n=1 Tax=unclassified Caulobacter TaxID=2648921 RepID=UPI003CFB881C